jgi:peptidoglycan-associated lipoprotein
MNIKHFALVSVLGAAFLAGCAKKAPPPPPPEPTPPAVSAPATPAAPKGDETAERRARIQARMSEVFRTVYFQFDQSSLTAEGKATAEAIAQLMQDAPEMTLRIEGHADERGTNEYNLALGERRAQAVQQYIVSYGIGASRISVLSFGEEKPAVDGKDESAWSLNRRAEFVPAF